ncbi:hypothetical protein GEOBRER4_n3976 [Citrifermentans bremense]|uniref:Uncharacterized protein n=1 Tax=Citrifermentans bremense TaxID=60035 RepID=A0A7R7FSL1_9BACT|nr:hypothetical protein GEOBRER4_n3976 [Citrifermentans bremense]
MPPQGRLPNPLIPLKRRFEQGCRAQRMSKKNIQPLVQDTE